MKKLLAIMFATILLLSSWGQGTNRFENIAVNGSIQAKGPIVLNDEASSYIQFPNLSELPAYASGRVFFETNTQSMAYYTFSPDVTHNIGQEIWVYGKNVSGTTITNGQPVHMSGNVADHPRFDLAQATTNPVDDSNHAIGLATMDISNNAFGVVCIYGRVNGINTAGLTEGMPIYLSTNIGKLTQTMPPDGYCLMEMGHVLRASVNNGVIIVSPNHPQRAYDYGIRISAITNLLKQTQDVVIGNTAYALDDNRPDVVIGVAATGKTWGVAIGWRAYSDASTVVGTHATGINNSVVFGYDAQNDPGGGNTAGGTAIGFGSRSQAGAQAFGYYASATTTASIALGRFSKANDDSTSMGDSTYSRYSSSTFGNAASSYWYGVAIGYNASAGGLCNIAIGGDRSDFESPRAVVPAGFTNTTVLGGGTATSNGYFHYRGKPVINKDGVVFHTNGIPYTTGDRLVAIVHTGGFVAARQTTYICNTTNGNIQINLPSSPAGSSILFKKVASASAVTVVATNSWRIDGATNMIINTQWDSFSLYSDGATNWYIF